MRLGWTWAVKPASAAAVWGGSGWAASERAALWNQGDDKLQKVKAGGRGPRAFGELL